MTAGFFIVGPQGPVGPAAVMGVARSGSAYVAAAVPDGTPVGGTDNRATIQGAIDNLAAQGGGDLYVPSGTYYFLPQAGKNWSLLLSGSVRMFGAGRGSTTFIQASGSATSQRLIYVSGSGNSLSHLCLDGNKANNSVDEHRAGVFAWDTNGLLLEDLKIRNFTGDAISLYDNCVGTRIVRCTASLCDRDGVAFISSQAVIDDTVIDGCKIVGNKAQQVDTECAPPPTNIRILGSYIDGGGISSDYVITCSGNSTGTLSSGYTIVGNTINGPIFGVWCEDLMISANVGVNPTGKPSIDLQRTIGRTVVGGNSFQMTQTASPSIPVIQIIGTTGVGSRATNIQIANNIIELSGSHSGAIGIKVQGAYDVSIVNNTLSGPANGSYSLGLGIQIRATASPSSGSFRFAAVSNNKIKNFGAIGIYFAGNTPTSAQLLAADVSHNIFDDDQAVPTMLTGVVLDDGQTPCQQFTLIGNQVVPGGGCTLPVTNFPVSGVILIGGSKSPGLGIYSISGTPVGFLTGSVGDIATRRDGGAGTTLYVKESGANTTSGWVAK